MAENIELTTGTVGTTGNAARAGTGGIVAGASENAVGMATFFKKQAKAQKYNQLKRNLR